MNPWIVVLLAGVASYGCRVAATLLLEHRTLPPWFERASHYVMPAAFAGIVAPALLDPVRAGGPLALPLAAAAVVAVLMARRHSAEVAMLAGMITLWVSHALVVTAV